MTLMYYPLQEDWNGLERGSSAWFQKQAEGIARVMYEDVDDYLDRVGLIEILNEMAEKSYNVAESAAYRLMAHLLYICISPQNSAVRHWRIECKNFLRYFEDGVGVTVRRKFGNTNIKNELNYNWKDVYDRAVAKVVHKSRHMQPKFDLSKIPEDVPWTIEDFLTKDVDELIEMIPR